ncbi:adenylate/guanylate cyclase domain-containing protein [Pigmentiphaga aceris]|uniref:Adenylate/guanylate cyclase domain-containing protein n=1 Tax=Pigmentiphaga aceris TaxID=1940612 RepID=A0A5C0B7D3_9BURK|nr:adenylate/guanylate cyclase domain-containing protein [Pigmentiphaga aceris]QEI08667.1 adenylate/guanylate cyclase domain-containing protein [Pigmentiphaga aceris]
MRTSRQLGQVLCVFAALAMAFAFCWIWPDASRRFDLEISDIYTRVLARDGAEGRLAIVDVDEGSLGRVGAWPWPRAVMATLLQTLNQTHEVSVMALDMVFPESKTDDALLAAQLRSPNVISAVVFASADSRANGVLIPPNWPLEGAGPDGAAHPPQARGYLTNHAGLVPTRLGHINPVIDGDGNVRRIQALICREEACYPTLTLAAYLSMTDASQLRIAPGKGVLAPAYVLTAEDAKGQPLLELPLAADFTLVVPYRHQRDAWASVPAADVLERAVSSNVLKGAAVLVGGTAFGLADVIATPLHSVAAGIEPHAETLSALLDGSGAFSYAPRGALLLIALWLAVWAFLLLWQMHRAIAHPLYRMMAPLVWLLLFLPVSFAAGLLLRMSPGFLLPATQTLLFGLFAFALAGSLELYRAARTGRGLFAQFSAYLPARMVAQLAQRQQVNSQIDATRRDVTVMFVDIRGFASMSDTLAPEDIAELLQHFFTELGAVVDAHGGVIDKYIGDAAMALWNAVDDDPHHAQRALAAASDVVRRMADFPSGPWGEKGLRVGVGIETGPVLVGHFGPVQRRTFTALGDSVVLASRYEELSRSLGHTVIVGPGTAAAVSAHGLNLLGEHSVRGHRQPLRLYTIE